MIYNSYSVWLLKQRLPRILYSKHLTIFSTRMSSDCLVRGKKCNFLYLFSVFCKPPAKKIKKEKKKRLGLVLSFHFLRPKRWIWVLKMKWILGVFRFTKNEYNGIFIVWWKLTGTYLLNWKVSSSSPLN